HDEEDDPRGIAWRRGSQWPYNADGDGRILAHSFGRGFVYALGDATALYDSAYEESTDIVHASRSIVWLEPDHVVVYDRAVTRTRERFKRFWLQLPSRPEISERIAVAVTPRGQRLVVTSMLPEGARLQADPYEPGSVEEQRAKGEPMRHRLLVEAPREPRSARFLHVLQGLGPRGAA